MPTAEPAPADETKSCGGEHGHAADAHHHHNAARAEKVSEFRKKFANPYIAAARGFIDEVIHPRETRRKLIAALKNLDNKRDKNPPKKHGNIPL